MTDTNQKLREALQKAKEALSLALSDVDWRKGSPTQPVIYKAYNCVDEALALPTAEQVDDIDVAESFTSVTKTAPPVGERKAFEAWLGITPCGAAHDFGWAAWQARAALSAGDAVDGPLIDEGSKPALTDAKIEAVFERYKGTPGRELRLTIGRALLAEASAAPALLIGWTDTTGPADIRWKEGLRKCDLPDKAPVYVGQPAAPALASWQPIETAPKDGSDCWLLVEEEVRRGFWVEIEFEERRDLDGRYIDQTDDDAYWMDKDSGDSLEPTMFYPITKPLPPAPAMRKGQL